MKKTFFAFILLLAFLLTGCSLGGKTAYVLTETETVYSSNGDSIIMKYFYDGDNISRAEVYKNGELNTSTEMTYDEKGFMTYTKQSLVGEDFAAEIYYENDAEGRPLTKRYVSTSGNSSSEVLWTLEYTDENGSYVESSTVNGVTTSQTTTLDEHGNITEFFNSSANQKTIFANEYDDGGRLIKVTTIVIGGETQITELTYFADGRVEKEITKSEDGRLLFTKTYKYIEK